LIEERIKSQEESEHSEELHETHPNILAKIIKAEVPFALHHRSFYRQGETHPDSMKRSLIFKAEGSPEGSHEKLSNPKVTNNNKRSESFMVSNKERL
jgi:hypothetical protein